MAEEDDLLPLPAGDFRHTRSYLAPHVFATWTEDEPDRWPPPDDLIPEDDWGNVIQLPTDVLLKTTSYDGSWVSRLNKLASDWLFAMPVGNEAPFMSLPSLIAHEEFDAVVFNAVHGYFRQALGCLRNVLEVLAAAAALAVTNDTAKYQAWQAGTKEVPMSDARRMLKNSQAGRAIDGAVTTKVFGDHDTHWLKRRYKTLCGYTHGGPGARNMDFWQSNGPIYVPQAFPVVEAELRETLALGYLLLKVGWSGYAPREGAAAHLLSGPATGWREYQQFLTAELT
ncbi:MAG: hypothetical protein ACLP3C_27850 [Mycobacterium sp.]|uniref:hypothetical protein n=1 Tax=Mycobacterium sp. TaxID=1785 RepID=UPI003F9A9F3D